MPKVEARRASRYRVRWPARVRSVADLDWQAGQVLNLSVTGVLLQLDALYEIGERVEVEIDFMTDPDAKTIVAGIGHVVRKHAAAPQRAAIHFELGCSPKPVER